MPENIKTIIKPLKACRDINNSSLINRLFVILFISKSVNSPPLAETFGGQGEKLLIVESGSTPLLSLFFCYFKGEVCISFFHIFFVLNSTFFSFIS